MPKNKRPPPRAPSITPEDEEDTLTQMLCDLALELAPHPERAAQGDFHKIIRKCLLQKKDEVLYESIERARDLDAAAAAFLKEGIEETAGTIVTRGDGGRTFEVNAFMIPLFIRTPGGLHSEQLFQDQQAFGLLGESIKEAQLESPDATVVLVSHAYHLDEVDRIAYSDLNEMVRDAAASMSGRKGAATSAIERSLSGWPENLFAPADVALELRFLFGFALKTVDDPFYQVPADEAAADAWFDTRAARFEQWTVQAAPLLKRCLASDASGMEINFLYQDLFHGAKENGMAEYYMLQMMSELDQALAQRGIDAAAARAVIGPADLGGSMLWRVNLYAQADGALVATSDKPLAVARELALEAADTLDALGSIGVRALAIAGRFDAAGEPVDLQEWSGATRA